MTMTRRFPQDDFAAQLRAPQSRPSFVAMVVAEWHKLVADLSRAFARKRIRRAATETTARATPLRTSKNKSPD
jgi:hypothetical protein